MTYNIGAFAFLFESRFGGIAYGDVFDAAFLKALSKADPKGTVTSQILRGDAIPDVHATRVIAVTGSANEFSHTQDTDKDLLKTVVWDMADAISDQWHTIDLDPVPSMLAVGQLHCICLPSLPRHIALAVDKLLKQQRGYVGAIEIDLGNPIQKSVFIDHLIKDAAAVDGYILMHADTSGQPFGIFSGADSFRPHGLRPVHPWPSSLVPPIPNIPRSDRGQESAQRLDGKLRAKSVQSRVLEALSRWLSRPQDVGYAFQFTEFENAFIDAELPEAKFVRYLLNPEHPQNRGKAEFFRSVLGLAGRDWRYLAAQLHDGLRVAELTELQIKTFDGSIGVSFNAHVPVRGLNGRVVFVDTNWVMEPGKLPRLITATPGDRKVKAPSNHPAPPIVADDLTGDDRWTALYHLANKAGKAAANECVPTPMKLVGSPTVEMEGLCGSANVIVPDVRRGFARWLIKSEKGRHWPRRGASIFALVDSQSYDRAVAYANAFAGVLRHNGIKCEVHSRLD